MTLFQWLSITGLGLLLANEILFWFRGRHQRSPWLLRCITWVAAMLAIANPNLVHAVAVKTGIGRGADLVLYLFVLGFLATTFYLYSRCVRLQTRVTELVRYLAIREAEGGETP